MKTSERGIALIKQFEGLELEAYQDIAGVWTIGYGHTGSDVEPGMRITEREAEALLRRDLRPRENAVDRLTKVPVNQNEFDALVSFIYNVGISAYERSTARRRLNRGDRLAAANALTWWNKATVGGVLREVLGLTRRRAAEKALFLTPANPPIVREPENIDDNSRITPVEDSPRRDSIGQSRSVQGATVAGGAGVAASTMGRDNAEELDQIETNIEEGYGGIENPSADEDSTVPDMIDPDNNGETDGIEEPVVDEDGNPINGETNEEIMMPADRPSKHEVH
ncbi:MAG: lysozyme, partial [Marinicaulis sp.]|nr:lysozyme [Marinicaulis sp.]